MTKIIFMIFFLLIPMNGFAAVQPDYSTIDYPIPDSVFGQSFRLLTESQKATVRHEANESVRRWRNDLWRDGLQALGMGNDRAVARFIEKGVALLREKGDGDAAYQIEWNYKTYYSDYLTNLARHPEERQISDPAHKPLIQFIEDVYNRLVAIVGIPALKAAHIADFYVLNRTLSTAFHPCSFDMTGITDSSDRETEYRNCVNQDRTYYGDIPIVTFFISEVACLAASSSVPGLGMLCGFIADGAEYIMATFIGPKISDFIWEQSCGA